MLKTNELQQTVATLLAERKNALNKDFEALKANLENAKTVLNSLNDLSSVIEPLRIDLTVKTNKDLIIKLNNGYPPTFIYNGYHYNVEVIDRVLSKELMTEYEITFAEMVEGIEVNELDLDLTVAQALVSFKDTTKEIEQEQECECEE